jgi:hypothetical protein
VSLRKLVCALEGAGYIAIYPFTGTLRQRPCFIRQIVLNVHRTPLAPLYHSEFGQGAVLIESAVIISIVYVIRATEYPTLKISNLMLRLV